MFNHHFFCSTQNSWIEFWERKKRQFICNAQTWSDHLFNAPIHSGAHWKTSRVDCEPNDDLREVKCSNKNSNQLLEVMNLSYKTSF